MVRNAVPQCRRTGCCHPLGRFTAQSPFGRVAQFCRLGTAANLGASLGHWVRLGRRRGTACVTRLVRCRIRHLRRGDPLGPRTVPTIQVAYCIVDLFDAPSQWRRQFDLVVEAYTLQVLPPGLRAQAVQVTADWVSAGGLLCLIRARPGGVGSAGPDAVAPDPARGTRVRGGRIALRSLRRFHGSPRAGRPTLPRGLQANRGGLTKQCNAGTKGAGTKGTSRDVPFSTPAWRRPSPIKPARAVA